MLINLDFWLFSEWFLFPVVSNAPALTVYRVTSANRLIGMWMMRLLLIPKETLSGSNSLGGNVLGCLWRKERMDSNHYDGGLR
jgi:hypothetical protein